MKVPASTDGSGDDQRFMREAIRLAHENVVQRKGGPVGAVVVHQEIIIAGGTNEVTAANDPTAHAEIVALRAACRRQKAFHLVDCVVYSTCEPCPMCLSAL